MVSPNTRRNPGAHDIHLTDPRAVQAAIDHGIFQEHRHYWDCCAGTGHIADTLTQNGFACYKSDVEKFDGLDDKDVFSFFDGYVEPCDAVVMNPPFKQTAEFLDQALSGYDHVVMFNRVSFLETVKRAKKMHSWPGAIREWPLTDVFLFAYRVGCRTLNEDKYPNSVFYAWYVFDKHNHSNDIRLHFIT